MRIIYHKKTNEVIGVVFDRVTSHLPPSYIDENSTYIDIDYDEITVKRHKLAKYLEENQKNLIGKTFIMRGEDISFIDRKPKQYMDTVFVDIDNPKVHKDVELYSKKGKDLGAEVEVEDIDSVIFAKIVAKDRVVGTIRLEKRGCCTYVYQEGEVIDRDFYPHYVGFAYLIPYLKGKVKWLDMGGFVKDDPDLTKFKKKWGEEKKVEVTWQ